MMQLFAVYKRLTLDPMTQIGWKGKGGNIYSIQIVTKRVKGVCNIRQNRLWIQKDYKRLRTLYINKSSIQQENINIYAPNDRLLKYMKQKWAELKGKIVLQ